MPDVPTDTHGDRNPGALRPHPEPSQPPEALDEPLDRLRSAADPDQIAEAVRDALARLPMILAGPDWLDDCGFDTEQHWWQSISAHAGAPATFQAARDHLADALKLARDTADEIRLDPDPASRSDSWLAQGPQTLRYVAGVSVYARGLLTHTTPQALQGVLEALSRLSDVGRAEELPDAVYDLLYHCNRLLVGDLDWEPALATAARRWYGHVVRDDAEAEAWSRARDHIARAAGWFQQQVQPWLHVSVDAASAAESVAPLVAACDQAWELVNADR